MTHRLRATGEREIKSCIVGEKMMSALQTIDEVAYIRFASVYRRFQDLIAFREEIDRLEKEPAHHRSVDNKHNSEPKISDTP